LYLQVPIEERRIGVDVEHARNPQAKLLTFFQEGNPCFGRLVPEFRCRNGVGDALCIDRAEGFVGCNIDEVGMLAFDSVETGLDVLLSVLKTNQNIELCVFSMDPSRATDKFTM
jgi:hypothetical protein